MSDDGARHAAEDATEAFAQRLCREHGLGEPRLVRRGSRVLFETASAVVRVGGLGEWAQASAGLARLLAASGISVATVRCAADDAAAGLSATVLDRIVPSGAVDWAAVGELIRRTHGLDAATVRAVQPLPSCTSFAHWRFRSAFDSVAAQLDAVDRRALGAAVDSLDGWPGAAAAAPQVVCHGDVHPGNVMAAAGGPVLLDWDLMCTGPAAWDHAALLTWEERWGGPAGMYAAFAEGYGADLRDDGLAQSLAQGRLLAATLMRLVAGGRDEAAAAEARRRLCYWRGEADAPAWRAM